MDLSTNLNNGAVYSTRGRVFGTISLVLIALSIFSAFIALPALVFGVLTYVKGEKNLGLLAIILSIIFFIALFGFNIYSYYGPSHAELMEIGSASAYQLINILK